jgi:hypothetical protein
MLDFLQGVVVEQTSQPLKSILLHGHMKSLPNESAVTFVNRSGKDNVSRFKLKVISKAMVVA